LTTYFNLSFRNILYTILYYKKICYRKLDQNFTTRILIVKKQTFLLIDEKYVMDCGCGGTQNPITCKLFYFK